MMNWQFREESASLDSGSEMVDSFGLVKPATQGDGAQLNV
jgi:hypothetical protein